MSDKLSNFIQEYTPNQRDTQRLPKHGSINPVDQLKTVRGKTMFIRRNKSQSENDTTLSGRQMDSSVSSQGVLREEEPSFVFRVQEEDQRGASAHHDQQEEVVTLGTIVQPAIENASEQVTCRRLRCKVRRTRISQTLLIISSLSVIYLIPGCYSFLRIFFQSQQVYKFSYVPKLPALLNCLPFFLFSLLVYFIVFLYYLIKTHLQKHYRIKRLHMWLALSVIAIEQLVVVLMWTEGWRVSQQVYQRFGQKADYESEQVVELLLQWRVLWLGNVVGLVGNVVAGVLAVGLEKLGKGRIQERGRKESMEGLRGFEGNAAETESKVAGK